MTSQFNAKTYVHEFLQAYMSDPPDTRYHLGYVDCLKEIQRDIARHEATESRPYDADIYVIKGLLAYLSDIPDTGYQQGYRDCLTEMKRTIGQREAKDTDIHANVPEWEMIGEKTSWLNVLQTFRAYSVEDVQDCKDLIDHRRDLFSVHEFLTKHDADTNLIEAIDQVVINLNQWSNPELEVILMCEAYSEHEIDDEIRELRRNVGSFETKM